jgi:hypothetical protein
MADDASRHGRRWLAPTCLAFPCLALLALAACRRAAEDQAFIPPDQLANAIEDVRQIKEAPPPPPRRLSFLTPADLASVTGGTACTLRQGSRTLLVAGAARALARVDGRPVLLDLAGPMDASAAFFRGPRVTLSIGRHMTVAPQADAPGIAWPVGVTVGALPQGDALKLDATWACAAPRAVREPVARPGRKAP